ncbi:undecaprenyldiphospho-muramoylpentapeptide beta-N-acetylglucosaminyltransferase [Bacillus sp. AFS017336]|uniref:undecaprenyldiphospho-muramoylpentapeptide beta-N-acetylglucosaminyltransferase n=1 Tax=Bacillus sp. AFS017336 TaxID=2033489 RepID=UPI000BF05BF3|nr:undecaprenyldiphospho-muramoylpentapeptide beta-N-acetylglucosaminyltransferase [Bacillus sp. AFS017336]PEL13260.1 undecaprenyldiphospho-muramoylpentapeptide beta-N-acetylglucosaminyltransferase [Bacillus sp. AFS017336]
MSKETIVFTGGGSAGHVTPNIAIINELSKDEWDIRYIGSKKGIEKELINKIDVPYYGISSGKLRRYIDFENVVDLFRVLKGCLDARKVLKKLKPSLVFSKGGFVSVPVIIAASTLKIPIYIHESDMTPGLANKISQRFATKIFTSFEEAKNYFPKSKTTSIGSPIRKELLNGSRKKGIDYLNFKSYLPIITVMGGSLGAKKINETVRDSLKELTKNYQIVHLCGKGNVDESLQNIERYKQFEYVHDELADLLAASQMIITRGGSNAIFEFLALHKPMLIIPLTKNQSRGDQILNAKSFKEKGYALMLEEEDLTIKTLQQSIEELQNKRDVFINNLKTSNQSNALEVLLEEIKKI